MNANMDPLTANPLLDLSGLPRFAEIGPEHVGPAIDALRKALALDADFLNARNGLGRALHAAQGRASP